MNLLSCQNYNELSDTAATLLIQELKKVISRKGQAVIALPGGRSVAGLLQKLSPNDVDWSKVDIFMVDERVVPIEDKDSNYKLAYDLFFHRVPAKVHPFIIEKGAEQYNQEFQRVGGHFDIIILGVGEDGHIAALFPEHPALKVKGKKYIQFDDSPKPPKERITASVDVIKDAGVVILLFVSAAKKKAYDQFCAKKVLVEDCPSKITLAAKELFIVTEFSYEKLL